MFGCGLIWARKATAHFINGTNFKKEFGGISKLRNWDS